MSDKRQRDNELKIALEVYTMLHSAPTTTNGCPWRFSKPCAATSRQLK